MRKKDQVFWVGQKAFIEKAGAVLILKNERHDLDFPGGKVQVGETNLAHALHREIREETGLEIEIQDPFTVWSKEFPPNHPYAPGKRVYIVGFRAKYISGEVKLSEEHTQALWVTKDDYREATKDRSNYFEALEKYFAKQ